MPDELIQDVSWPGIGGVLSCSYTVSHGITPGVAILTTYPQTGAPAAAGDLVFSDGLRTVTLRDCRAIEIQGSAGPEGQTYHVMIEDRRWRWKTGKISG